MGGRRSPHRQAIARGEKLFNTRSFVIDNVAGLNGRQGDPVAGAMQAGTCTVCHDTPNAGNHSISMPLNLGLTTEALRTPDLPLYTIENKSTHERVKTTDPGTGDGERQMGGYRALQGADPARPGRARPYFHNGSVESLDALVDFYNTRFHIGLTPREERISSRFSTRSSRRRRFAPRFVLSATPAGFSHPAVPGSISRTLNENVDPSPGVLTTCTSLPCRASSFREIVEAEAGAAERHRRSRRSPA